MDPHETGKGVAHYGIIANDKGSLIPGNWDQELIPYLPMMSQVEDLFKLSIPEIKVAFKDAPLNLPADCPSTDDFITSYEMARMRDGAEIELQIYTPKKGVSDGPFPLFFVMHGGGWTIGNHGVEEVMNRLACVENGFVVVSPDYRMAPSHPFPYPINDCLDALIHTLIHASTLNIIPSRTFLGGSSAGGNLAASLCHILTHSPPPSLPPSTTLLAQILNIPSTVHPALFPYDKYPKNSYPAFDENSTAPFMDSAIMTKVWDCYNPTRDKSVLANPLLASSFAGLPPALISVAGLDPLRDQGVAYARAMEAEGCEVVLDVYKGIPHGWMLMPELGQSKQFQRRVAEWMRGILERA